MPVSAFTYAAWSALGLAVVLASAHAQPVLKAGNPAGVALEILPGTELPVGTKIKLRVTSKRPGFLVVVDVDAAGKVVQIYPNPGGLKVTGAGDTSNRIRPRQPITVPPPEGPAEFLARPPLGTAMVVAILSDRPVQVFDLPDVPADLAGRAEALRYLADAAGELRLAGSARAGQFVKPQLSFDAKLYVIK